MNTTLYGRNATGGAINIISASPSDEFEFKGDLGACLEVTWEMAGATLTSITGFTDHETGSDFLDLDDSEIDLLYNNLSTSESEALSQEFILTSNIKDGAGSVEWLAGLLYFTEDGETTNSFFVFGNTFLNLSTLDNDAFSVFGEITYHSSEKLQATFGLRYSEEDKKFTGSGGTVRPPEESWYNTSPKFTVNYFLSENTMQVKQSRTGPFGPLLFISNAGSAKTLGVKAEIVIKPTEYFETGLNLAYLNAEFDDDTAIIDASLIPPFGNPDPNDFLINVDGNEHWMVRLWGRNLTDELNTTHMSDNRFGLIEVYAPPRTYGLEIAYTYLKPDSPSPL